MRRLLLCLPLAALGLAGCADYGPKQMGGGLLGAGLGAWGGSQFGHGTGKLAATAGGGVLGGLLGGSAGQSLDRADRTYYANAYGPRGGYGYAPPPAYYAPPPGQYAPPTYGYAPPPYNYYGY